MGDGGWGARGGRGGFPCQDSVLQVIAATITQMGGGGKGGLLSFSFLFFFCFSTLLIKYCVLEKVFNLRPKMH